MGYPAEKIPTVTEEGPLTELRSAAYPKTADYIGIFLVSAGVLLFELSLTRIFAVLLWANLAFMVVGTALFGFGLSGVYLALKRTEFRFPLSALCVGTSVAMFLAYQIIRFVPFQMWEFRRHPEYYLTLAVWEIALTVPFFLAGLVIARLLSTYPVRTGRLYGFDLLGAACGSLLLIPLIRNLGGEGLLFAAAALPALAGAFFGGRRDLRALCFLAALCLAGFSVSAADSFPLELHQKKRRFREIFDRRLHIATMWSPLSRVDVSHWSAKLQVQREIRGIWIDGGTNASVIFKWSGDMKDLPPQKWSTIGAAYDLKEGTDPTVLVIGAAGGKETMFALSRGASHIDAVEMDPSIYRLLNEPEMSSWMGRLYQHERVSFINDEGRAFLRRTPPESYDIIQFVNNYTPAAIAAGALNLSETFLVTVEAFQDYFSHLKPDGVLALHRGATLRLATTALAALRELGIPDPERHIVITSGEFTELQGFFLKKTPWTIAEIEKLRAYLKGITRSTKEIFHWQPFETGTQGIYAEILRATPEELKNRYYHGLGLNLEPATDDRPFLEHYSTFGAQHLSPAIPPEFRRREREKWQNIIPRGDFPYVTILAESALLGLLFVGLPLLLGARRTTERGFFGTIAYFAALGLGFITVEICVMKSYVLFLGSPAYSITTVIVALLLGAGLGSLFSERFGTQNLPRALMLLFALLLSTLAAEALFAPLVFTNFLHQEFGVRVAIALALLVPLGFLMGMPFPFGLRMIAALNPGDAERRKLTAWAWGINGYTTVIGSALTVFIALSWGFRAALFVAGLSYLLGAVALLASWRVAARKV